MKRINFQYYWYGYGYESRCLSGVDAEVRAFVGNNLQIWTHNSITTFLKRAIGLGNLAAYVRDSCRIMAQYEKNIGRYKKDVV